MTISLVGLIILVAIAAVCGAIGRAIAGNVRGGLIVSIALGFIGTLLGPWVAQLLKLPEPFLVTIDGRPFPILWSIIGAALFVAIVHLFSRRRW
ncbi:Transglycosylase-associated protein [Tumidithrix helvetica PCC 7403]|uniref:GlsB/YeaQ/YmgE family stress response membrane protein n=1 Tax=Tumidithrix helvetica TaxID=3457545 RepID=UPI003C9BFEDC